MRSAIPILFITLYIGASTELHQLLRIPVFFSHYQEHKSQNPNIGLLEFIVIHYLDTKTTDYKMDQQLPFKNAKCPEAAISVALPPENIKEAPEKVFDLIEKPLTFKSLFIPSSVLFSIWQPPRI